MKAVLKRAWMPVIVCMLPLIWGISIFEQLPAEIPSHWDFDGNINGYMDKASMVYGLPVFLALLAIFVSFMLELDPKKKNQSATMQLVTVWTPPVMGLVLMPMSLFMALGYDLPITPIVSGLVGVVIALTGNYMPKSKQNYTIGIRLPWTLNSEENWNRTHRLAGYVWVVGGLVIVALSLVGGQSTWFGTVFGIGITVLVAIPGGYSYYLYRKGI